MNIDLEKAGINELHKEVILESPTTVSANIYRNNKRVTFKLFKVSGFLSLFRNEFEQRRRLYIVAHKWANATLSQMVQYETNCAIINRGKMYDAVEKQEEFDALKSKDELIMELIEIHKKLKNKVLKCKLDSLRGFSQRYLINLLNEYDGRYRTGDKYVRLLFECALIYYIDKFGEKELDKVINKIFVWAYKLRLELQAVRLASMDNRALETDVFKTVLRFIYFV